MTSTLHIGEFRLENVRIPLNVTFKYLRFMNNKIKVMINKKYFF